MCTTRTRGLKVVKTLSASTQTTEQASAMCQSMHISLYHNFSIKLHSTRNSFASNALLTVLNQLSMSGYEFPRGENKIRRELDVNGWIEGAIYFKGRGGKRP